MPPEPTRLPSWIEQAGGVHPGLTTNKATGAELKAFLAQRGEALAMQDSMGRGLMSDDQRFLAQFAAQETVSRETLAALQDKHNRVQGRAAKIAVQKMSLAAALYKQGRNEEALAVLDQPHKFKKTRARIRAVQVATDKPDSELHEHKCKRRVIDGMELDRRFAQEEIYSLPHRAVVTVYCCSCCGELNATPEIPERQRGTAEMRTQLMAQVNQARPGETVNLARFADGKVLASL